MQPERTIGTPTSAVIWFWYLKANAIFVLPSLYFLISQKNLTPSMMVIAFAVVARKRRANVQIDLAC